jgi:Uma2 family endonuclease
MSILASTKRLLSDNWPVPEVPAPEPEPLFDDEHFELVDGVLVEKVMGVEEQSIDSDLLAWLSPYVRENGLGWTVMECKFALPKVGNNRIPDLAFVSYATWPKPKRRPKGPYWSVAPDLAVEVISPTDVGADVMDKMKEYFTAGCKAVWIVWPTLEQIHVYSSPTSVRIFGSTDTLEGDPVIPGFRLPLIELFPPEESDQQSL